MEMDLDLEVDMKYGIRRSHKRRLDEEDVQTKYEPEWKRFKPLCYQKKLGEDLPHSSVEEKLEELTRKIAWLESKINQLEKLRETSPFVGINGISQNYFI